MMSIILFFTFIWMLKICIILIATIKYPDGFIGCKWDFSAFWRPSVEIYGHMHLLEIMYLLPSKSKHTILHWLSEEWICYCSPCWGPFELSVFWLDSVWNGSPWRDGPNRLSNHLQGNCLRLHIWITHSSHFSYWIFIIEICLLKYTSLLLNTWKIYDFCIAFYISVLNSMNT